MEPLKTAADLRAAIAGTHAPRPCTCALGACAGWESLAEYRWEETQMSHVATLRDPAIDEPTLEEFHPAGTRYDSPQAPVAGAFFPYNRCDVWHCRKCDRHLLRYTEFGGYNVDHRIRVLDPDLIAD
ncbi:MAG: hypothetical protein Q7T70_03655 [Polaromonas sp.]|nr:hypothetical protein [Polaromonas sp.]